MRTPLIVSALFAAGLLGCDHQKATDGNLADGLNHSLAHLEPCPGYTASSFPMTANAISPRADLEALAGAGLVSKARFLVNGTDQIRYDLTDKGRDTTFTGEKAPGETETPAQAKLFCFGRLEVDKILTFTEPAEAEGMHVTRVTYTRKLTHQPGWATDKAVLDALPNFAPDKYAKNQLTTGMVQTSNGWRLPDDTGR